MTHNKLTALAARYLPKIYWLLPILAWLLYIGYTLQTLDQIRYEEMAESIRNVYWLKSGKIYDYVSHNIGMYWVLLQWYKLVGFSLFAGKWFFMVVALVSNFALAGLLKKVAGYRWVIVPLLTILLSPARIYFTAMQALYGIDLLYLPILLFLLVMIPSRNKLVSHICNIAFWLLLVITTFSYSVFMFYLPVLLVLYGLMLMKKRLGLEHIGSAAVGLLLGLVPLWEMIKKYDLFAFYTHMLSNMQTTSYSPTLEGIASNIKTLIIDFFAKGSSYNYELVGVDFSYLFPILTLIGLLVLIPRMWQEKQNKNILLLLLGVVVFNLYVVVINNAPTSSPGMRRLTPLLFSIYALYTMAWITLPKLKNITENSKKLIMATLLILPLHHVIVLPQNLVSATNGSAYEYKYWFSEKDNQSPQAAVDEHVNNIQSEDIYLTCDSFEGQATKRCRYPEVYAAIKLQCEISGLKCGRVWGYDLKYKGYVQLDPVLWEKGYWEH